MKKPKHLQTYVPGFGVVGREDFTENHMSACVKQVKECGLDVDAYIASRFDTIDDEVELKRLIAEEESKAEKPKKGKEKK